MTRSAKALLAMSLHAVLLGGDRGVAADLVRVGEAPFLAGGAFYIARDKGYFKKLNLQIETTTFADAASAARSLIAGELDLALIAPDASLFNRVAKGAPFVIVLDGGRNRRGFGCTVINVTQALHEDGVSSVRDACAPQDRRSKPLCLDLAAVTYMDAAGAQLLRELLREGIEIAACSSFLRELLHLDD